MSSLASSRQKGPITTPVRSSLLPFPAGSSSKSSISSPTSLFDYEPPPSGGEASPFTPPDDIIAPSAFKQALTNRLFFGTSEKEGVPFGWRDRSSETEPLSPSLSPGGRRILSEPREYIFAAKLKLEPLLSKESDSAETDLATQFTNQRLSSESLLNTHQSNEVQNRPPKHRIIGLASSKAGQAYDGISSAVSSRSRKLHNSATVPRLFKSLNSDLTHDEYLLIILDDCLRLRDYWGNEPERYPPKYRGLHQDNRSLEKYHRPVFSSYKTTRGTINEKIRNRILAPLGIKGLIAGWVYILESTHTPAHIKIGYTGIENGIEDRIYNLMRSCNLPLSEVPDAQQILSENCYIVEQLAMIELQYCRKEYMCVCRDNRTKKHVTHGEWFEIDKKKALEVVQRWRTWMVNAFDDEGRLKGFWRMKVERLTKHAVVNWDTWTLPPQSAGAWSHSITA